MTRRAPRRAAAVALILAAAGACAQPDRDATVRLMLDDAAEDFAADPFEATLPAAVERDADVLDDGSVVATLRAAGASGECWQVSLAIPATWVIDGAERISAGDVSRGTGCGRP